MNDERENINKRNELASSLPSLEGLRARITALEQERDNAIASSREKVHRAFKIRGEGGECRCPYCTGDVDGLADMVGNYELDMFSAQQKAEAAEATLAGLRAYVQHKPTCIVNWTISGGLVKRLVIPSCTCGLEELLSQALAEAPRAAPDPTVAPAEDQP